MDYFDDLINVYGYLRSESRDVLDGLRTAAESLGRTAGQQEETETQLNRIEALLRQAAEQLNIEADFTPRVEKQETMQSVLEKISLPGDMDYERAYDELVVRAREAGFVNVHSEDLLSKEEMEFAQAYQKKLDEQFAKEVQLNDEDLLVVGIGAALHVVRAVLAGKAEMRAAAPQDPCMPQEPVMPPEPSEFQSALGFAQGINDNIPHRHAVFVKPAEAILQDEPCFQRVSDGRYPEKKSILGCHPLMGWVFGVYNAMTDTVSCSDMHTFFPADSNADGTLKLSRESISLRDLAAPFMGGQMVQYRDAILSAVIREAFVLFPKRVDFRTMAQHYAVCQQMMDRGMQCSEAVQMVCPMDGGRIFAQTGMAGAVNMVIMAMHSLFCREPGEAYTLRTLKVITAANWLGSAAGSVGALIEENLLYADWGGLISAVMETLYMTRFWIDAKAEFLTSAYMPELRSQLHKLDDYFQVQTKEGEAL